MIVTERLEIWNRDGTRDSVDPVKFKDVSEENGLLHARNAGGDDKRGDKYKSNFVFFLKDIYMWRWFSTVDTEVLEEMKPVKEKSNG